MSVKALRFKIVLGPPKGMQIAKTVYANFTGNSNIFRNFSSAGVVFDRFATVCSESDPA